MVIVSYALLLSSATIYNGLNVTTWLIMCLYCFHELLTHVLDKMTVYLVYIIMHVEE